MPIASAIFLIVENLFFAKFRKSSAEKSTLFIFAIDI